ncbi:phage tail protein [Pseudomonas veronii]
MANLPETEDFAEGTYQIETSDRVVGGPGGIANKQAEQLGNRTAWLKAALAKIIDGTTTIGKAAKLATARTLKFKGAISGSGNYDGSADTEITLTLADTGVAAGTYPVVTVGVNGLVSSGRALLSTDIPGLPWTKINSGLPTSLSGYGITNAYTMGQVDSALNLKAPLASPIFTGAPGCPMAPNGSNNALLANTAFVQKAVQDAITAVMDGAPGALDTLKELATALGNDPNFSTTILTALNGKAAKATTLVGYGIADALALGQYGLGATAAPMIGIDTVGLPGGFYYFGSGGTGFANNVGLVNIPYGNSGYAGQIGFRQGLVEPDIYVRGGRSEGVWGNTRRLWHSGNLDPNAILPTGTTIAFAGPSVPVGFLKENGAAVSRAAYADLFAVIGTTYGAGNGSTTFNLPDSRGEFIRGLDDGRGVDSGRSLSSAQADQMQGHRFALRWGQGSVGSAYAGNNLSNYSNAGTYLQIGEPISDGVNGEPRIGAETRSRNVARLMCIKY